MSNQSLPEIINEIMLNAGGRVPLFDDLEWEYCELSQESIRNLMIQAYIKGQRTPLE